MLGPPPTSGTRDAFVELVMENGCSTYPWIKALKDVDEARFKKVCDTIREDSSLRRGRRERQPHRAEAGGQPEALGIFGYSFLEENVSQIQGATIDGVAPTFDNIASSRYPVSRPLFIYVKKAHLGVIPGLREFVAEYISDRSMGARLATWPTRAWCRCPPRELAKVRANALGKIK